MQPDISTDQQPTPQVSFYKNIADTKSKVIIPITDILNGIKKGKYKKQIDHLRSLTKKAEISDYKKTLPNFTASGTFSSRIDNALIDHSELIQGDFDKVKDIELSKSALIIDPFIFACFLSPTGTGLKILVRIDPQQHNDIYTHLEQYFKDKYDLTLDPSCRNIGRAMFVSYDPDLFHNTGSDTFLLPEKTPAIPEPAKPAVKTTRPPKSNDKAEEVVLLIKQIEANKTDITGDYNQWLKIGFALASEFGASGEDFFHRISCQNQEKYNQTQCSKQYSVCCKGKKSGVTLATLFSIAKDFNILAHPPTHKQTAKSQGHQKDKTDAVNPNEFFCYPYKTDEDENGNTVVKSIGVNWFLFTNLLLSFGFRRFDIGADSIYIHVDKNIVKQVTKNQIQDYFINWIDQLPDNLGKKITKKLVKEKVYANPQNFFCDNRLSLLKSKETIEFKSDTKNEAFIYFNNGYVKCTKDGWELHPYDTLNGHIWQRQIIQRDFVKIDIQDKPIESCVVAQFMFNLSGKKEKKFNSFCSLGGYLMHGYTDIKLKAVILTDSKVSKKASGRTGKTLWGYILGKIIKVAQINGKDFDPTNRWKWQSVELDDKLIFINDIKRKFPIESLFNDITEKISVEKKNQNPFTLQVKMFIATNETILIEGGSSKDRCVEFEVANHYSDKYSPEDEFKQRFFTDWNKTEWQQFDNFMMYCICIYLGNGIIEPENTNLNQRKLLDQTNEDFIEFMEEKIMAGEIVADLEIWKQDLHSKFLADNPDLKDDKYRKQLKTFSKWIKTFAEYSDHFDNEILERKSNEKRFFTFKSRNIL